MSDSNTYSNLLPRITGGAVITLGVVVSFGWILDIAVLKSMLPGLVSMKVNTAVGMFLAGLSLYAMAIQNTNGRIARLASLLAMSVFALGIVTLIQDIFGWDLGVDQMLFKDEAEALFTPHPGRMSVLTSIGFSVIGVALYLVQHKKLPVLVQVLVLLSLTVSALPLGGYLFGDPSFPHIGPFSAMAVHTALGFLVLSVGVLALTIQYGLAPWLRGMVPTLAIGSATALLVLSGLASYVNTTRQIEDSNWVAHTHQVQAELQGIYGNLSEVVLDLRGFLITGDERFNSKSTRDSRDYMWEHFNTVLQLTQDNPAQQQRLQKIKSVLQSRMEMIDERITLRRHQGITAAVDVVNQDSGDGLDDQIRDKVREMVQVEQWLLEERQIKSEASNNHTYLALSLTGVVGLGLILLVLSGLRRQILERKETEEVLSIAAVAFDTHEAIMITGADANIIRVNRAFEMITGYGEEEVLGRNPNIMASGRHDSAFYEAMWHALLNEGAWSGEVWERHKSGTIYPKQVTISAVKDKLGEITNYVAIFNDISERKKTEKEIHQLAFYDALTELPNRRLLLDRLGNAISVSARNQLYGALLFLDMDNFKTLNDTLGHAYGDMLLVEVAKRIRFCVREVDTVARLGGDEFVVLIENLSADAGDASESTSLVAEKIRAALATPYQLKGSVHHSSPSIGVSLFLGDNEEVDELLKHADMAMYQAKEAGRNNVRFYDPKMQHAVEEHAALELDFRKAIRDNQLSLHYQVQLDHNRKPIGAEALVRWVHPTRGMVSPVDFIPVSEESSLILNVGYWVLDTACQQLVLWSRNEMTRELVLAVNISASQFKQPDFVEQISGFIQKYDIEPSRLKLELTESVALEDIGEVVLKMLDLTNEVGVSLSLDDFGTGYSSLSYLKQLPLQQVKIDRAFVRDMTTDESDAVMVKSIINMAQNFGLNVIAEGVETEEQFSVLKEYGCMAYQGYLFGKPMQIDEFEALLKRG